MVLIFNAKKDVEVKVNDMAIKLTLARRFKPRVIG